MIPESLPKPIRLAIEAAQDKKASAITALSLEGLGAFAEHFLICSAESARQIEAIGDAIEEKLREDGFARHGAKGAQERNGCCWITGDL